MGTQSANVPNARRVACARCGTPFPCGLGADCWCAAEPYRMPVATAALEDCLCPACLRRAAEERGAGTAACAPRR